MNAPKDLSLPIRAATETALAHGIAPDRCEILQNGHTLVLRLSESLVARVVTDLDGPRQGAEWFEREIAVARFLAENGTPVIPVHPGIPPGPHELLGYLMNFWQYVDPISGEPDPATVGETLYHCHRILTRFPGTLPELAILTESLDKLFAKRGTQMAKYIDVKEQTRHDERMILRSAALSMLPGGEREHARLLELMGHEQWPVVS